MDDLQTDEQEVPNTQPDVVEEKSQEKIDNNLQELDMDIDEYEMMSGVRLVIQKSEEFARTYKCKSHVGCCFRAKFGRKRRTEEIRKKQLTTIFKNLIRTLTKLGFSFYFFCTSFFPKFSSETITNM